MRVEPLLDVRLHLPFEATAVGTDVVLHVREQRRIRTGSLRTCRAPTRLGNKFRVVERPRNVAKIQIEESTYVVTQFPHRNDLVLVREKMIAENALLLFLVEPGENNGVTEADFLFEKQLLGLLKKVIQLEPLIDVGFGLANPADNVATS
jgi:hypothetical protein